MSEAVKEKSVDELKEELERAQHALDKEKEYSKDLSIALENKRADLAVTESRVREEMTISEGLRKKVGEMAAERDRWKARAEVDARLVDETSVIHLNELTKERDDLRKYSGGLSKKISELEKELAARMDMMRQLDLRASAASRQVDALQSSAAAMQHARDKAQKERGDALIALADANDKGMKLEVALKNTQGELDKAAKALGAITVAHRKGHPKRVNECAICAEIGE